MYRCHPFEFWYLLFPALGLLSTGCTGGHNRKNDDQRPNILLILADDMGYSDPGCYGGEILTPNIDRLAANGLRYTQFYNAGRCCPTRASLLTGLYQHQVGMGWMTAADLCTEGYQGQINHSCVTLAEVMKNAGYSTYMVGKWHVTADKNIGAEGPKDSWPLQRGFDKYYGPHHGGGSYFNPSVLTYGNDRINAPPGYYVTDALSDTAAAFIRQHNQVRPFFMYVGYTAPHFPLQAKPEDIEKYLGKYTEGWDALRKSRFEHLKGLGILDDSCKLSLLQEDVSAWEELTRAQQMEFDRRMAVYAAQIDNMDQGIGRIIESLQFTGQYDNTAIFFLSDNGGTAEYISRGKIDAERIGTDESYESYRKPWATVSNTPFRMFKQWVHEGGIATPFIVHWPAGIRDKNALRRQVGHVIDLMPTFLDLSGGEYPQTFLGNAVLPAEGLSLVPTFENESIGERTLFWEHQATRAVRIGDWKLVADKKTNEPPYVLDWELYNLAGDRSETDNLAEQYAEKVVIMDSAWNAWAERCNVYPLDGRGWFERLKPE